MKETTPTRRPKKSRKPTPNPVEKAEHLQPAELPKEQKELSIRDRQYLSNQGAGKYARKSKAGTPKLGRSTAYDSEPGLGYLTTTTAYDNTDVST